MIGVLALAIVLFVIVWVVGLAFSGPTSAWTSRGRGAPFVPPPHDGAHPPKPFPHPKASLPETHEKPFLQEKPFEHAPPHAWKPEPAHPDPHLHHQPHTQHAQHTHDAGHHSHQAAPQHGHQGGHKTHW